jgi:hypothetical protein
MSISIKRPGITPDPICIPIGRHPLEVLRDRTAQAKEVLATNPEPMWPPPEDAQDVGSFTDENGREVELQTATGADGERHLYAAIWFRRPNPMMGMADQLFYYVYYDLGVDRARPFGC